MSLGVLSLDEMSISEGLYLDEKCRLIKGFVDFKEFTPPDLNRKIADHGLVFMFTPFQGQWVQVIIIVIMLSRYIML